MRFLLALKHFHRATSVQVLPIALRTPASRMVRFSSTVNPSKNNLTIWYILADECDEDDPDGAFAVSMPHNSLMFQLCNAIVAQENCKLAKLDPSALEVFESLDDFLAGEGAPLENSYPLASLRQTTEEKPLCIMVPYSVLPHVVTQQDYNKAWLDLLLARKFGIKPDDD